MIDKAQLEGYKRFNIPYQTEKDYLQDLLLYNVYKTVGTGLVLKGGTALSKVYRTDRFSEDLDFTMHGYGTPTFNFEGKDSVEFAKFLIDKAISGLEYNVRYLKTPSKNRFGTVGATIGIEGPRYSGKASTLQHMEFEISTNGSVLMRPSQEPIMPVYAGAMNYVATVMNPNEMLSEKFRAICSKGRHHRERDLYDVYVLMGKGFMPDRKVVGAKFSKVSLKFSTASFGENVASIADTWERLRPLVQHTLEDYGRVKDYVMAAFLKAYHDR